MFASSRQHPILRSFRFRLPLFVVALALGACDGEGNAFEPGRTSDEPAVTQSTAPGNLITALTSQRIAFASYRNGNQDIYLMDPQGYNVKRLTTSSAYEVSPAWSWDNKRLALVRPRLDASNITHYDIYLINADGTNGHWARSTPSPYSLGEPSWSPDGSHLLVTISANAAQYVGWLHVATGNIGLFADGSGTLHGKEPSYDPAGQRIVFVGSNSKSLDVMNANGTGHVTLFSAATPSVQGPAFSPDGKRIVFGNAISNGDQELFVRNADGSIKRLTYAVGTDLWPSWSPDGTRIVFGSTRNGQLQIWSMSAAGGSATRLSHNKYAERTPAWSH